MYRFIFALVLPLLMVAMAHADVWKFAPKAKHDVWRFSETCTNGTCLPVNSSTVASNCSSGSCASSAPQSSSACESGSCGTKERRLFGVFRKR